MPRIIIFFLLNSLSCILADSYLGKENVSQLSIVPWASSDLDEFDTR